MDPLYLKIIFLILLFPGIVGVALPFIPGILYMFLVSTIFWFLDLLSNNQWYILLGLAILSVIVDYSCGMIGAKFGGASRKSLLYGILGLILGVLLFPPFGGILGLFLGIAISEFLHHRDETRAVQAAAGSMIGSLTGITINLAVAITFFIFCITFIF